jgi:hypothetical protein
MERAPVANDEVLAVLQLEEEKGKVRHMPNGRKWGWGTALTGNGGDSFTS